MKMSDKYLPKLIDYIRIYKNIVSPELCDKILAEYKKCNEWRDARVGGNGEIRKDIRNVRDINISDPFTIGVNAEVRQNIDNELYKIIASLLEKYKECAPHSIITSDSGYTLLEYSEGCFYKEHTDHFITEPRSISCSLNLNDDYTGGEFTFFEDEVSHSLGKGDVIMFPSNFMYPHAIKPVLSGTRYSIITWFN
jgi:predicted 2-oxoglutarate/Fe(II)-dependent dioxygenase YbiX